jgi:hypothetical protein
MTPLDRTARPGAALSTTHQARIHRISEGVVASYIHDISTSTAVGGPSATARRHGGHALGRATRVARASSAPGGRAPSRRARHRPPCAGSERSASAGNSKQLTTTRLTI